ncbi:MAG: HemK2/MTQ2 family protein methyltransferase [Candidatus Thorarchaeota archaeon]
MIPFSLLPDPLIECDFENVYFPSDDTYLLIDYFKKSITKELFDGIDIENIEYILDMGTGTGIIAILLQYFKSKIKTFNPKIIASDILDEALFCAKKNELLNNFHSKIIFIQSDLFNSFPEYLKSSFNIIIFNPPYLPSSSLIKENQNKMKIDHSWNGGQKGYEILIKFFQEVKNYLNLQKPHYIYYISSSRTNLENLHKKIKEFGFKNYILKTKHIFFEDLFLNRLTAI